MLLDDIEQARRQLDEHLSDVEMDPGEAVCERCRLVYWVALGYCANCAALS